MFVIGLIGAILAALISICSIIIGIIDSIANESSNYLVGGLIGLAFSIVAIVAASTSRRNRKLSSILMIISGVLGSLFVNFSPIAGILLVISGLIGLLKKETSTDSASL